MATITAANSQFSLAIADLYPTPQSLQGYAADDAFSTDAVDITETVMGVDGHLSGGFVFNPVSQTINIMPDSPSLEIFENWYLASKTAREVYVANGTIIMPAISRKFTLKRGFLISTPPIATARKTLQPLAFSLQWESVTQEQI